MPSYLLMSFVLFKLARQSWRLIAIPFSSYVCWVLKIPADASAIRNLQHVSRLFLAAWRQLLGLFYYSTEGSEFDVCNCMLPKVKLQLACRHLAAMSSNINWPPSKSVCENLSRLSATSSKFCAYWAASGLKSKVGCCNSILLQLNCQYLLKWESRETLGGRPHYVIHVYCNQCRCQRSCKYHGGLQKQS